jgi:two-component sensor histidine kinase
MLKRIFILLLLVLATAKTYAQDKKADSLLGAIDTASSAIIKANAFLNVGEHFYQSYTADGYNKAATYYQQGLNLALTTSDSELIAESYVSMAQVYDALAEDKLPKALEYYTIFTRIANNMKPRDTGFVLFGYINMANVQEKLGLKTDCLATLEKLTAITKYRRRQNSINQTHVFAAFLSSKFDEAALCKNYLSAVDTFAAPIKNDNIAYRNYYFLALLYLLEKENKVGAALQLGKQALTEVNNISDSLLVCKIVADIAVRARNYELAYGYRTIEYILYRRYAANNALTDANNTLLKGELSIKEQSEKFLKERSATQTTINRWLTAGLILGGLFIAGILWLLVTRRKQNQLLATQVTENKLLLQEVHHRVKNNLQIVSSFMLLQQLKKEQNTEELVKQLQGKIQALALIHQKLHQQNNHDKVQLHDYFQDLIADTITTHASGTQKITYTINAAATSLDLDRLTPLALITNELLLNSIKYVAAKQDCHIKITALEQNGQIVFNYSDNGQGFNAGINFDKVTTTGLRLVKRLAGQIKAAVTCNSTANGLSYQFVIPL